MLYRHKTKSVGYVPKTKKSIVRVDKSFKKKKMTQTQPLTRNFLRMKYNHNSDVLSSTNINSTGTELGYVLNGISRPYQNQALDDKLPMGFDQQALVWDRYKVIAAKIKIEVSPNDTDKSLQLVMQLNSFANYGRNIQNQAIDNATAGLRNTWTYPLPTDKKFVFSKYVSIAQLEGITKNQFSSDLTLYNGYMNPSAAAATLPEREVYFKIALVNNTDNTAVSIPYEITIDYYTQFSVRQGLLQSKSTV